MLLRILLALRLGLEGGERLNNNFVWVYFCQELTGNLES